MKKLNFLTLIFAGLILTVSFSAAKAQEEEQSPNDAARRGNFNQSRRPNLLAELDLSPEQISRIRRINAEKRAILREAQMKMRDANHNLDKAIYADVADETEIQSKLKDAQIAQAEVSKIRSMIEYAVRKVLTPDQLIKFREIRQRFMERLENIPKIQKERPLNAPHQRILNRQRRMRPND